MMQINPQQEAVYGTASPNYQILLARQTTEMTVLAFKTKSTLCEFANVNNGSKVERRITVGEGNESVNGSSTLRHAYSLGIKKGNPLVSSNSCRLY